MRVLNIEDDTFKHNDICKALSGCGIKDVEWSNNLADGWKQIKNSIDSNNPYDLIITDMYYPGEPGGREEQNHNTCNSLLQRESQIPGNIWLCLL